MLQQSVLARMVVMAVLLAALMVPLALTQGVISERTARRDEVADEISRTWGRQQTVLGPVLSVPYRYVVREERRGDALQAVVHTGHLVLLPEELSVQGRLDSEVRARGPFEAVVYTSHLGLQGRFGVPDTSGVDRPDVTYLWDEASLALGVSDTRGIASGLRVTWNGADVGASPGVGESGLIQQGVQVRRLRVSPTAPASFAITLDLRGTTRLAVVPVGNDTVVRLGSAWPHPGFSGGQLPLTHRIGSDGFEARWQTAWFARGFPATWTRGQLDESALRAQATAAAVAVDLVQPVDVYQQAERAVKYGVLFIVLTLAVAFVREVTSRLAVHPVQYLFVGFGLCLFYLLLVSLAEHIRFDLAYLVASIAIVSLLSWYWSGVLRGWRQGATMAVALTALYGYLYLLLRLEDLALLAGTSGLFVMLALLMAMTSRVDWFALRLGVPRPTPTAVQP
jgi:inner membrane protein